MMDTTYLPALQLLLTYGTFLSCEFSLRLTGKSQGNSTRS